MPCNSIGPRLWTVIADRSAQNKARKGPGEDRVTFVMEHAAKATRCDFIKVPGVLV